jgi:hypothetical protein
VTRDEAIAWAAAGTHVLSSAASLLLMRGGLPPFDDEARLAYIVAHRAAWTFGWMTWHLSVLTLISLFAVLALRLGDSLSWSALAIASVGAAIDLPTQVRYYVTIPEVRGEAFVLLDRELQAMTAYAANGLYTLAFLLVAIAGWRLLPALARVLAGPIAVAGFAFSIGALQHNVLVEIVSSALLFPLFILWTISVARWLRNA